MRIKSFAIFLILVSLTFLTSCDNDINDTVNESYATIANVNIDLTSEYVEAFAYDENDNFYYNDGTKFIYCINKSNKDVVQYELSFSYLQDISYGITDIAIYDNKIYYMLSMTDLVKNTYSYSLNKYDIDTKKTEELDKTPEMNNKINCKLDIIGNKLIYILANIDYIDTVVSTYDINDMFLYFGERIKILDLDSLSTYDIGIDLPISFAKYNDNQIYIYAYNETQGYYFSLYDIEKQTFGKKQINNLRKIINFEMAGTEDYIICRELENFYLEKISNDKNSYTIAYNLKFVNNKFLVKGNEIYFTNLDYNSNEFQYTSIPFNIKKLTSQAVNIIGITWLPSLGYTINSKNVEWEEMALKLMANDSDWDVCFTNSSESLRKIVENKLYYPLNDIPEINNFYDKAYPYIKDAATTDDNKIWSMIYETNFKWLAYKPEKLSELGINISTDDDFNELFNKIIQLKELAPENVMIYYQSIMQNSLREFQKSYTDIGIDKLNDFITMMFQASKKNNAAFYCNENEIINFHNSVFDKYFSTNADDNEVDEYLWTEVLAPSDERVRIHGNNFIPIPSAFSNNYLADCKLIIVNPRSENLEYTLNYIASLSEYIMENDNSYMFDDKELYTKDSQESDVFDIYKRVSKNAKIVFTIEPEIIHDPIEKLFNGEWDVNKTVNSIDNSLKTYYNE